MSIIKDELLEVKEKHGDERRSRIEFSGGELSIEDMIPDEKVVITISHAGYIKRTPLAEYKTQNRGGVGQKGSTTRSEDFLEYLFVKLIISTCYFLLKREDVFGCVFMRFLREVKFLKVEQYKTS